MFGGIAQPLACSGILGVGVGVAGAPAQAAGPLGGDFEFCAFGLHGILIGEVVQAVGCVILVADEVLDVVIEQGSAATPVLVELLFIDQFVGMDGFGSRCGFNLLRTET